MCHGELESVSTSQSQFLITICDSLLILFSQFNPRSPSASCSRHLLANHERRPLVAEIRYITQHFLTRSSQGFLEIFNALKVESGLNTVGRLGTGIGRADKL